MVYRCTIVSISLVLKGILNISKQVGNIEVFDEISWMGVGKEKLKRKRERLIAIISLLKVRYSVEGFMYCISFNLF